MANAVAIQKEANNVRGVLEKMKPQMEMALPRHLSADRLIRVAMTSIQNAPKLLECDRTSLYSAIMTCAQLGLEPDGVMGQAYLIPFGKKVQFVVGYRGLITLARNSGNVMSIQAQAVCENDHFVYSFGINETLEHVPADGERGDITHFWALTRFNDGGHYWDVMTRAEVEQIRDNSQGYQSAKRFAKNGKINSPWTEHFEQMGRKTVIRRIAKYLPMDVQKAAAISAEHEAGRHAALDEHGDIQVDSIIDVDLDDVQTIENKPSTLDKFADAHTEEFDFHAWMKEMETAIDAAGDDVKQLTRIRDQNAERMSMLYESYPDEVMAISTKLNELLAEENEEAA